MSLRRNVLLGQIHGNAIVTTAMEEVKQCDRKLAAIPPLPTTSRGADVVNKTLEIYRKKAEAYDRIAKIVRAVSGPH